MQPLLAGLCRALLRALSQGRLQGSGTLHPWHCPSFAPWKCNPCCLLWTAGLAGQGSSLHLTSELQKSCSFPGQALPSTQNSCFLLEITKFANPGGNCRINPYPHSIPQCHKSRLLGPADKSSAITQLHSSSKQAEGECRGAERVPGMVISQGTRTLLAALPALLRADCLQLGVQPLRAPSHREGPRQRCRWGPGLGSG